mgnify:CR=1 FL=1
MKPVCAESQSPVCVLTVEPTSPVVAPRRWAHDMFPVDCQRHLPLESRHDGLDHLHELAGQLRRREARLFAQLEGLGLQDDASLQALATVRLEHDQLVHAFQPRKVAVFLLLHV